jgi:hypothetical protein
MGASNHLLDFDTSLFRTSSRRLRRIFFSWPVPFSWVACCGACTRNLAQATLDRHCPRRRSSGAAGPFFTPPSRGMSPDDRGEAAPLEIEVRLTALEKARQP